MNQGKKVLEKTSEKLTFDEGSQSCKECGKVLKKKGASNFVIKRP